MDAELSEGGRAKWNCLVHVYLKNTGPLNILRKRMASMNWST